MSDENEYQGMNEARTRRTRIIAWRISQSTSLLQSLHGR